MLYRVFKQQLAHVFACKLMVSQCGLFYFVFCLWGHNDDKSKKPQADCQKTVWWMLIKLIKRTQHLQLAIMEHSCPCLIKHLNVTKRSLAKPSSIRTQDAAEGVRNVSLG